MPHTPLVFIIPLLRENPKIFRSDDVEIVGNNISERRPLARQRCFEEVSNGFNKLPKHWVVLIMRHGFMHDAP
jgi:hypothetical protein